MGRKCHRHIWLLSGTGDGPPLAEALISRGWNVTVSVASSKASLSYSQLPLQSLSIKPLEGMEGIRDFIEESRSIHNGFDYIIDATHPFAQIISSNLRKVCREIEQPFIRYERDCPTSKEAILINSYKDLIKYNLNNQKILFAIGEKVLPQALKSACIAGAEVFARVLPTVKGIRKALISDIDQCHIAVLQPLRGGNLGEMEAALCRKWGITGIVARQSGGPTQKMWQKIAINQGLSLWLIARPSNINNVTTVKSFNDLFNCIESLC